MALDTSIYQQLRPVEQPDFIGIAGKAANLSALSMQNRQAAQTMGDQDAVRQAYARNIGADGQLNRAGVLSDLARSAPTQAVAQQGQFAQMDAAQADQKQKVLADKVNQMGMAAQLAMSAKDQNSYNAMIGHMKDNLGLDTSHMPAQFDPGYMRSLANASLAQQDRLKAMMGTSEMDINQAKAPGDRAKTAAETGKLVAETRYIPAEKSAALAAQLYGSRSPTAELASQYTGEAKPARGSQFAMQQMIDNYNNPSPQGDASLVLNAFKIKFPNAPDVNSLHELSTAQGITDQMRAWASQKLEGVKDPETRANLMRDGISTFRANVEGLRETQGKYNAIATRQGVDPRDVTSEPAIDKTHSAAMALQDKIGPYVPPGQRGGLLSSVIGAASPKSANAAPPPPKNGTVDSGYVFMGGDPGNKSNWKKAQ